jgi:(hydroxyamino)benzene mutase
MELNMNRQIPIDLRLARHGAILLFLGMLTGFVIGSSHNPKTANGAHLTGLIGGYGLIALGLLWPRLKLGRVWSGVGAWVTAVSLYLNWIGLFVLAEFGSGPNAANAPHLGSAALWDRTGGLILMVAVILSLVSGVLVLVGLRNLATPVSRSTDDEAMGDEVIARIGELHRG